MNYRDNRGDDGLTPQERIRVLAIQATDPNSPTGGRVEDAERIATFIAGPEAAKPFPWERAEALAERLRNLLDREAAWQDDRVQVDGSGLREIYRELADLTNEPPF